VRERRAVQTRDVLSFGKEEEEKNQINESHCLAGTTEKKGRSRKPQEPGLPYRQKNRCRLQEEPPAYFHVPWKPSYIQEGLRGEEEKRQTVRKPNYHVEAQMTALRCRRTARRTKQEANSE
jgi:hypothetical protein